MNKLVIREATPDDIGAMYDIELKCFTDPWTRAMLDPFGGYTGAHAAVAELDGCVKGFVFIYIVAGDKGESNGEIDLADIAVNPDARRMGIAKSLLGYVYDRAYEKDCGSIFLEVRRSNTAARALYESEGFAVIGERKKYYTSPVEDAVIMKKELAAGAASI
ncbi:MAG: ribosomal protein S18-alanine N-acetyltransferase [Clostridia bacterium]|nr:ribosomal protein S18-alanine N-acetyltransferase [Clostridia bacterium]